MYQVHQVMRKTQIHSLQEYDSLATAIEKFDDFDISAMPVKNELGQFVGVLSKSDIARRRFLEALRSHHSPDKLFVKDFMNHTKPIAIQEHLLLRDAIHLLHRRGIHRLFVTDQNNLLIGVLSATDIIKVLSVEHPL